MPTTTARPASEKTTAYVRRLMAERDVPAASREWLDRNIDTISQRHASAAIDHLRSLPYAAPRAKAEPGFYVTDDSAVIKVKPNRAGTSTYAMRLAVRPDENGRPKGTWEYAPGVGATLAGITPLTGPEAARLGLQSGVCVCCGATLGGESLSAQVSAVIGYGQTCAGNQGWTYPTGVKAQRAFLAAA